jgi:hypothetical protein
MTEFIPPTASTHVPPIDVRVNVGRPFEESPDSIVTGLVVTEPSLAVDLPAVTLPVLSPPRELTANEYALLTLVASGVMDEAREHMSAVESVLLAVLVYLALWAVLRRMPPLPFP